MYACDLSYQDLHREPNSLRNFASTAFLETLWTVLKSRIDTERNIKQYSEINGALTQLVTLAKDDKSLCNTISQKVADIASVAFGGGTDVQSSQSSVETTRAHVKMMERIAGILNELVVFLKEFREMYEAQKSAQGIVRMCVYHMLLEESGSSERARGWISELLGGKAEVRRICVLAFEAVFDCIQVRSYL